MVSIKGLDKAEVFKALYDKAKVQGLGFLNEIKGDMQLEKAKKITSENLNFDYVFGRVMKVDLSKDEFDQRLYDRDNGDGAAELIISEIRN